MQGGSHDRSISCRLVCVTLTVESLMASSMRDSSTLISSPTLCEMLKGFALDGGNVHLKVTRFPLDDLSSCEFANFPIGLIFILVQL